MKELGVKIFNVLIGLIILIGIPYFFGWACWFFSWLIALVVLAYLNDD